MNVQDPLMFEAEVAQTLKCSERPLERLARPGSFPPPPPGPQQASSVVRIGGASLAPAPTRGPAGVDEPEPWTASA